MGLGHPFHVVHIYGFDFRSFVELSPGMRAPLAIFHLPLFNVDAYSYLLFAFALGVKKYYNFSISPLPKYHSHEVPKVGTRTGYPERPPLWIST